MEAAWADGRAGPAPSPCLHRLPRRHLLPQSDNSRFHRGWPDHGNLHCCCMALQHKWQVRDSQTAPQAGTDLRDKIDSDMNVEKCKAVKQEWQKDLLLLIYYDNKPNVFGIWTTAQVRQNIFISNKDPGKVWGEFFTIFYTFYKQTD